ncbi:hypothetical protein NDU88_000599 [Pleurodeles waltl]|uniref:Uncharacterized protein n=1 Tax=Pleurodeles waltl TaxID=8319 RepID=A0AAV7S7F4_PLEWA|nr:hypothetical protein NDU88_000599 [Pleurodeles waltl]
MLAAWISEDGPCPLENISAATGDVWSKPEKRKPYLRAGTELEKPEEDFGLGVAHMWYTPPEGISYHLETLRRTPSMAA